MLIEHVIQLSLTLYLIQTTEALAESHNLTCLLGTEKNKGVLDQESTPNHYTYEVNGKIMNSVSLSNNIDINIISVKVANIHICGHGAYDLRVRLE